MTCNSILNNYNQDQTATQDDLKGRSIDMDLSFVFEELNFWQEPGFAPENGGDDWGSNNHS